LRYPPQNAYALFGKSRYDVARYPVKWREAMTDVLRRLWSNEEGQDIAEYAVLLAVILVLVVGTVRLIGANANNVFSQTASSISQ
jgi:Flp pilus assembly pilin Flp